MRNSNLKSCNNCGGEGVFNCSPMEDKICERCKGTGNNQLEEALELLRLASNQLTSLGKNTTNIDNFIDRHEP